MYECALPEWFVPYLEKYKKHLALYEKGQFSYSILSEENMEINSCINCMEVEQEISSEQANYLRKKYL